MGEVPNRHYAVQNAQGIYLVNISVGEEEHVEEGDNIQEHPA